MTDQKHTKELEKINDNRGLNPMEAYLLIYNLCSTVIKDLADLRRQRDELREALMYWLPRSKPFPYANDIFCSAHNERWQEHENLLTKTKESK